LRCWQLCCRPQVACALEAAVVVPTMHAEVGLAQEPWSVLLRICIALVRLSPLLVPYLARFSAFVSGRFQGWSPRRFRGFCSFLGPMIFCPEVRWGIAITLDMWYLLTTPLNKDMTKGQLVILLVVNVVLCFIDTLALIMMLAVKNDTELEQNSLTTEASRPLTITVDEEVIASAKFDMTCIICLCDFRLQDEVTQLPCTHAFHTECISKWLSRSRHCPLRCPQTVLPLRLSPSTPVEVLDEPILPRAAAMEPVVAAPRAVVEH